MSNELTVQSDELKALFSQDAQVGVEDMGTSGKMPMLVMLSSQSTAIKEDEKDDAGKDLKIGRFFHSETRKQYDSIEANILYIKEAYLPKYQKPDETSLNYIIGGIIRDETKAPFIMYIKGMSLSSFFNFKTDIQRVVSNKQQPVPMYALIVEISKEVKDSQGFGKVNTIKLSLKRDKNGLLLIETDVPTIMWLKDGYGRVKESVTNLLDTKEDEQVVDLESDDLPFGND